MHPFVLGELACGNLRERKQLLNLWHQLPQIKPVANAEVLALIEFRRLFGKGIGWIDAHLLTSAILENCQIFTLDKKLAQVAITLHANWS